MSTLPSPGHEVGGFLVEERVHSGGMAVLFRVSRPGADFPLIMKVPRLGFGEPATAVVSFEVEQLVLGALGGPHVPRVVASGDLSEVPYLVMERVEGRPLQEWVERAPIPAAEVARLGVAVASAVHDVHRQDAIHLDVKPANVILRPSGEAVLLDFGIAHHAHYPDLLAEELHVPVGTGAYMAPEQVLGIRSDPRSDVFALGAVLYQLATARLPFGSPSGRGGLRRRLHAEPVPPRAIVPAVPEWLQEVILRCLEVRPEDRYPSAAQLALDLANPDQVGVTERGRRVQRAGTLARVRRWMRAAAFDPAAPRLPAAQLAKAPIVLAAINSSHPGAARNEALREAVAPLVASGQTRLACLAVIPPVPEMGGATPDQTSSAQRIKHRIVLRNWAEPLALRPGRISYHVVESTDPAAVILEYARANQVDHVVIGAPPARVRLGGMLAGVRGDVAPETAPEPMRLLRLAWNVATRVAAEAPCTVTVVRSRDTA